MNLNKKGVTLQIISLFLVILAWAQLTSAEIIMSQPNSVYNIGDNLNLSVSLMPSADASGFFLLKLSCEGNENELYKTPESISANQQKTIPISLSLDKFVLTNLTGSCSIKASYNNEEKQSQDFEISNGINGFVETNSILFSPSEAVLISGIAKKKNGSPLVGFLEINVNELNVKITSPVINGKFAINFTIPENAAANTYNIEFFFYEKDKNSEIINQGSSSAPIRVRAIVKKMGIALNSDSVSPNSDLEYSVLLYDQAENQVQDDSTVSLFSPSNSLFSK